MTIRKLAIVFSAMCITLFGIVDHQVTGQDLKGTKEPTTEAAKLEQVLRAQEKCWNEKDIDGFMQTYWKSEKLTFSGGGNTTRGWQATLDRYKKRYPPEKMGMLHFDELETTMLGSEAALVLGKWHLNIQGEKLDGNFSLVLRKIKGNWKIIHDHSSTLEKVEEKADKDN